MDKREEMVTQTTIIGMGWTKSMIEKLLPEPTLVKNPRYKAAAPMKLFKKSDVLKAMKTEQFQEALQRANCRQKSAAKAVETKKKVLSDRMSAFAESVTVTVLPYQELIRKTLEAKRNWYEWHLKDFSEYVDEETLKRWVVNYIRHNLVKYDEGLYDMRGKTGKEEVYPEFKNAILDKIALAYPAYSEECQYQKEYFIK